MVRGLVTAVVLGLATVAAAPEARAGGADWLWGGGLHAGVPTGDFDDAVDEGWGAAGHLVVLPHARPFGLRLEVSALVYGSRTFDAAPTDAGYGAEPSRVDTWFGNMMAGPELRARGGVVRPYAHLLAGVGYFATTAEPGSRHGGDDTTHDDATFAWAAGGGVEIAVSRDVSIDLGARYLANGSVDYLTSGPLVPGPGDAGPILVPRRGEPHVVAFTLGIAFGR